MKTIIAGLICICSFTAAAWSWGDEDQPMMLWDGSWVCSTPEAYGQAVDLERNTDKSFTELKKDLLDRKLCIYIDGGDVADMMAPYVIVVEEQANMVKVKFMIESYKKFEFLHRRITRVTFGGWTDKDRLRDYYDWLNNS
tara:strand:- start:100 stop:519 length:420 start_codon:yes stop_codon:yes gene_type:complete